MKTYNYIYNSDELEKVIDFSLFTNEKNILVQLFCGQSHETLKYLIQTLRKHLPQATCISTTTDGEICTTQVTTLSSVISISVFEKTTLKIASSQKEDSFKMGEDLASQIIEENTKLLILFSDGTCINAEEFLKGISAYKNVPICGGMAGDNGKFEKTYIAAQEKIFSQGVVGVSLNSDDLEVIGDYKFDWKPIGVEHTIDKVIKNRVYLIDGIKSVDFYKKYLGDGVSDIEFPLIVQQKGIPKARAVIAKHTDGSLSFGGNLHVGEKVKIGFGNAKSLLKNPLNTSKKLQDKDIDAFFLYSCMARRRYIPDLIHLQPQSFAKTAPTAGFFTYAEFYHHAGKNELLNQTLTFVALKEKGIHHETKKRQKEDSLSNLEKDSYVKTIQSLTNLIEQSTRDYDEQSKRLEKQMNYSKNLLQSHKQFLRHTVHEMNLPLNVIMGNIELHEMSFGKSVYLENIEVGVKSIFALYDDLSYLVRKDQISYFKRRLDLADYIRSRVSFFEQVAIKAKSKLFFHSTCKEAIIYFNDTKLQRIVDNNLTNAIKYTYENEQIDITLEQKNENFLLSIRSHSRKIHSPEKIFEEYYREEESKEGFGLGLNLVKRICVEEDVKIDVFSDEDSTEFIYTFTKEKK
jgi:anti-sigma regulatory factor (Ser/Thr protein kinase)